MAETFVFDDKIESTDGKLTLEVTPASELGIEESPVLKPVLEVNAGEAWEKSAPELVVDGATLAGGTDGAGAIKPGPQLVLDGEGTAEAAVPIGIKLEVTPAPAETVTVSAPAPVVEEPVAEPKPAPASAAPAVAAASVAAAVAAPAAAAASVASPAAASAATFPQTTYAPAAPAATYVNPAGTAYTAPANATYGTYGAAVNAQAAQAPAGTYPSSAAGYVAPQNAQATYNANFAGTPSYAVAPAPQEQLYMYPGATIPMTQRDRYLRMFAFILNLISTASCAILILPLAWMIPMTVISWGIYKGTRPCTTLFAVVDLIFTNLISGILLLIAENN